MRYDRKQIEAEVDDLKRSIQRTRRELRGASLAAVDSWAHALDDTHDKLIALEAELKALDALDAYLSEWHERQHAGTERS